MAAYIPLATPQLTELVVLPKTYTTLIDEDSSTVMYIGKATPGSLTSASAWQIAKLTRNGNDLSVQYAAEGGFNQIWNNRSSLSYS